MARFHIKDDGNPGLCRAKEGACPKGGAHFDSEEEARGAVEQLFGSSFKKAPEPLPVYTKTAVKQQFLEFWDPKTGYLKYNSPQLFSKYAYHDVREVYDLLTESRLDVKTQNAKVREELATKMAALKAQRDSGKAEDKIKAAVTLTYLSGILEENYELPDTRTPRQRAADEDFVYEYTSEYSVLPGTGNTRSRLDIDFTEEELTYLASFEGKAAEDFTDEELEKFYHLNSEAKSQKRRWEFNDEELDGLEYYKEVKRRQQIAAAVPHEAKPYLLDSMQDEKLAQYEAQARKELTHAGEIHQYRGDRNMERAVPLAELAADLQAIRADNELLRRHVLEA